MNAPAQSQITREDALNFQKSWLVETGDRIGGLAKGNRDWGGQARVLWEAARVETEPAVLLNLLRYQRARNKNWVDPEDVFKPLETAIKECVTRAGTDKELARQLILHLLVYTIRAFTYFDKTMAKPGKSKA